jgi:hypothetical protein
MKTMIHKNIKLFAATLALLLMVPALGFAQVFDNSEPGLNEAPDDYIIFAEGNHIWVDNLANGVFRADTEDSTNTTIQFNYGNWEIGGFQYVEGLDIEGNRAEGDTLFVRINSSTENSDEARETNGNNYPKIIFMDQSSNDNFKFRAQWRIPNEVHTGEWMEIAVPLPQFESQIALDSAKVGKNADGTDRAEGELGGYMQYWEYWGTYTDHHVADTTDPLWREFNWNNIYSAGIYWDQAGPPDAPIYIDNTYIGNTDTDISVATQAPDPLTSVEANEVGNNFGEVSWTNREDILSYAVYMSGSPITDVEGEGVLRVADVTDGSAKFEHKLHSPHPDLNASEYYYAVAAGNAWGLVNEDVSTSAASITAAGEVLPHVFGLTAEQETNVFDAISRGDFPEDSFPTDVYAPFDLKLEGEAAAEDGEYTGVNDASAKVWMATGNDAGFNTIYFYVEALDDDFLGGPTSNPAEMAGTMIYPRVDPDETTWIPGAIDNASVEWNYYLKDQLKIFMGTYSVDNFVNGSNHELMQRGAEPDYYLSFQPIFTNDGSGLDFNTDMPDSMLTRIFITEASGEIDPDYNTLAFDPEFTPTATLFEAMTNDDGEYIGWKAFVAIEAADLTNMASGDTPFVAPAATEIKLMPLSFIMYDFDSDIAGDDGRGWWQTSSSTINYPQILPGGIRTFENTSSVVNMGTVAYAGSDVSVNNEDKFTDAMPDRFELKQNYPNPFNPSTQISFSVPETQNVKLNVYNTLGQKVATLLNERMNAGSHSINFNAAQLSSGIYFYELVGGDKTITKKMTLIK